FIGRAWMTERSVVQGSYSPGPCSVPDYVGDHCFEGRGGSLPQPGNGNYLSVSESDWEAPGFAAADPARPVRVQLARTVDRSYDAGGQFLSRVETSYSDHDAWGNVLATSTRTYAEDFIEGEDPPSAQDPISTVSTISEYFNDGVRWRLGRLTDTAVTHQRPDEPPITRCARFWYDLESDGAYTGLLTMEQTNACLEPVSSLRTFHV